MASDLTPAAKQSELVAYWLAEIEQSRKREQDFREDGTRTMKLYEAGKREEHQYNVLFSNTETMAPALYNSTPRPVVTRRFKDEDTLGAMASKACQRTLEYLSDDGMGQYQSFDDLLKQAVLEALVPGRGVTRFIYDAKFERAERVQEADTSGEVDQNEQEEKPAQATEHLSYETVCGEAVSWDRFFHGYGKQWKDVPWVGYLDFMTKEELKENFGELAFSVELTEQADDDDGDGMGDDTKTGVKTAAVYQIWDKVSRQVYFVTPAFKDAPLKVVPDPLGLSGFFNCPEPLTFIGKISSLTPIPPYMMYEEQAKELNRVTVRINRLISALKVRGMYDAQIQGIERVFEAEDNVLIPAENVSALNGTPLEKGIWTAPIEKYATVLQQLYLQRQQVKQVIFEITGIADIMRGSTQASETLGAQEIKNQWGTLRLKRSQKRVARYSRDCLRIMGEIATSKLGVDTLKGMTGLGYPTNQDKMQAQMMLQQTQLMGMPPPEQAAAILQQPSWEDILGLLRDDLQRSFRIDIETNSTIDAEATEDKQDIAELLNAVSQFLTAVGPLISEGIMPFEIAKGMLTTIVTRFRLGPEFEDQLKKMQPPQPKPDPKVAAEQAKMQNEQQMHQLDMEAKQMELQYKKQEMDMKMEFEREKLQMERVKMSQQLQLGEQKHQQQMQHMAQQATLQASLPQPKPAAKSANNSK